MIDTLDARRELDRRIDEMTAFIAGLQHSGEMFFVLGQVLDRLDEQGLRLCREMIFRRITACSLKWLKEPGR